jgi:hypothetical protein
LRSRRSKVFLRAAVLGILLAIGAGYVLSHWRYVPPEPLAISQTFIDLVQAGDLSAAYLLTDQRGGVGATFAAFDANIRHQLGIDSLPSHRPTQMIGVVSGPQTYGNRVRRWLLGRELDPDQISIDYWVGLPFEIRLAIYEGNWRIVFFQSHAT